MANKRFSRVYVEITNRCNRACTFCPGTRRAPGSLTAAQFALVAEKLRGYTDYLYLHVLGEPLLHPALGEILRTAADLGYRVALTTNGTLLPERGALLLASPLYKLSISLHSFEANEGDGLSEYLTSCTALGRALAEKGTLVSFRLWNLDGEKTQGLHEQNGAILAHLHRAFPGEWAENTKGFRLSERVYLEYGERFDWPDASAPDNGSVGTCHGLRDQLAVLCDGSVVPCCLDSEGTITLGNLLRQEPDEILASPRAAAITEGFRRRERVEDLCRRCGYATRF